MDPINVPCPFCAAREGEQCASRFGTPIDYFHNRRIKIAAEAVPVVEKESLFARIWKVVSLR